jgi:hypothetical protein
MAVPDLAALDVAADADAWRALGFTIDDGGVCSVDGVAIRLGCAGHKISAWALTGVPGGVEVDGLPRFLLRHRPTARRTPTGRSHWIISS